MSHLGPLLHFSIRSVLLVISSNLQARRCHCHCQRPCKFLRGTRSFLAPVERGEGRWTFWVYFLSIFPRVAVEQQEPWGFRAKSTDPARLNRFAFEVARSCKEHSP